MKIALIFTKENVDKAYLVYNKLNLIGEVYLIPSKDIICPTHFTYYDLFYLLGEECKFHSFIKDKIIDKNFNYKINNNKEYFINNNYNKEDIYKILNLNKEEIMERALEDTFKKPGKKVGIFYSNIIYEEEALNLLNKVNGYRIYLKDISYERLIAIDDIDCICILDCPSFRYKFNIHIPIVSKEVLINNIIDNKICGPTDLIIKKKSHVKFNVEEEDLEIKEGLKGIPKEYKY